LDKPLFFEGDALVAASLLLRCSDVAGFIELCGCASPPAKAW